MPTLRERIENNLPIFFLATLVTGFAAGFATYRAIQEANNVVSVRRADFDQLTREADLGKRRANETASADLRKRIVVDAIDSVRKNLEPREQYGNLVTDFPSLPVARREAIYKFPAVAGSYRFTAEYASAESRPVRIDLNGQLFSAAGLSQPTGGFDPSNVKPMPQGQVLLVDNNTLELSVDNASFPHLKRFIFEPIGQ